MYGDTGVAVYFESHTYSLWQNLHKLGCNDAGVAGVEKIRVLQKDQKNYLIPTWLILN